MRRIAFPSFLFLAVLTLGGCFLFGTPEIVILGQIDPAASTMELASGTTISFGQPGYEAAQDLTFTVRNDGDGDLTLTATAPAFVTLTETTAGDHFSIPTQPTDAVIPPAGEETFVVTFDDKGVFGTQRMATITISSDDEGETTFELSLVGELSST